MIIVNLATHPDIQNRVYEEICEVTGDNVTHETIKDLHYLEGTWPMSSLHIVNKQLTW